MLSSIKKLIRAYWKPYLLIFAIYTIGLITMMRDHFLVLDDLSRSVYGYNWGQDWNRVTSSIVGYFLHQSITIFDISPINQLIAIAILSLSSLLLAKLFTKKLTPPVLFFSTFLGLAPFMVNAWQFHFDSPFFALAILVSILPYTLYWGKLNLSFLKSPSKSTTKFLHLDLGLAKFLRAILVTTICLSIMWTSFQSANGIFLVRAKTTLYYYHYFYLMLYCLRLYCLPHRQRPHRLPRHFYLPSIRPHPWHPQESQ